VTNQISCQHNRHQSANPPVCGELLIFKQTTLTLHLVQKIGQSNPRRSRALVIEKHHGATPRTIVS
jgi:hypothetical protein